MTLSTSQKWLVGCGIGCGLVILVVVGLVTSTVLYVRGRFQPLQDASESRKQIVSAYGAPETYAPPASGVIAPGRMNVFLSVRDALKDAQIRMDAGFTNIDFEELNQRKRSFGAVLRTLSDVSNVIIPIGEYVNRRNHILLEKQMGLGEYAYIYSIAYHSWLGHPPEEGPELLEKLRRRGRVEFSGDDSGFTPEGVRQQYRRLILRLLRNQLDGIREAGQEKWRAALKEEIDRMASNLDRVAWQDNLPTQIEDCLKAYQSRLASTYHASANYFELLTTDEFGQARWNATVMTEKEGERRTGTTPVEAPEEYPRRAGEGGILYEVGSGVVAPVPIDQPSPPYTEDARKARVEGVASFQAIIRTDGTVGNLKVIRSLGYGLDEAAMNTIATRWKFKPGALKGAPVDVRARIDVRFRLE